MHVFLWVMIAMGVASIGGAASASNPEANIPQVAVIDWFPFGWQEDGRDKGMFIDLVALYSRELDTRIDAVVAPVPRVIRGMEDGEFDFTLTYRDTDMMGQVTYIADIGCLTSYIISYRDNPVTSLEGLNGLTVAYPGRGYFAKRYLPHLKLDGVQVTQTFVMFRMALRRRLDAFVINDAVWEGYRNNLYPGFKVPQDRWADFAEPLPIDTMPLSVSIAPGSKHSAMGQQISALAQSDAFMAKVRALYAAYKLPNATGCLSSPAVPTSE
ncbi:substrate-binding periplasmic protein [Kordiimonas lacus]|uniref:ABC-type amino acid transport substrate-binding protein n=1 Tax=Kordiimonas lacus TaxID=637679 RepID=A0A1G7B1H8_9PROT|nr:transporter substrate-binding domain-containing protein [Kordiimonas lacus]SDE20116.1 hypothetical protein SAMN04488071_2283 [Kordiimonas lacus]